MQNRYTTQNVGQLVITYPTNIIASRFVTVMSSQFNGHLIGQCKFVQDTKEDNYVVGLESKLHLIIIVMNISSTTQGICMRI